MIFDTDGSIWPACGSERAARAIDAAPDRAMAIVSLMELLQGARSKPEARQIQKSLRQLQFRILPLCTGNAKHFRPIRALSRVAFRP
jgi:predicted nucleic acid-binding protein